MNNPEIVRMNLVGMEPELRQRIKNLTATVIRAFDGAPEHVTRWNEARELYKLIEDIEAGQ